jgi:hypothetical protein
MAATLVGDGTWIPPFYIKGQVGNASKASGRRPSSGKKANKGMTVTKMIDYIDHVAKYVDRPSVLCMDRLSSHVSKRVITYAESLKCSDGVTQKFKILLLTPKAAFLISPLDMGFFTMFKRAYYKYDRSTYALKIMAANQVWKTISSDKIVNLFNNCGITSKESPKSLHNRIAAQVRSGIPDELEEVWEFYQGWLGGAFNISGATCPRAPPTEHLIVPNDSDLNGQYWIKRGPKMHNI